MTILLGKYWRVYEQLGKALQHAGCLCVLAKLLQGDGQLDATEEVILKLIELLPKKVTSAYPTKNCEIYHSRAREGGRFAITRWHSGWHPLNQPHFLFWICCTLSGVLLDEDEFNKAQVHVEQAKTYIFDNSYPGFGIDNTGSAKMQHPRLPYTPKRASNSSGTLSISNIAKFSFGGLRKRGKVFLSLVNWIPMVSFLKQSCAPNPPLP